MSGLLEYPMYERVGVVVFLQNYNYLKERLYTHSDYDALIMLIDFDRALLESNLTPMELMTINLVFKQDMSRVSVANLYGVTRQTVQTWLTRGTEKIATHYAKEGVIDE